MKWLNADQIEKNLMIGTSLPKKIRQAKRMRDLADEYVKKDCYVIADFICPTKAAREIFNPQFIIWVDTIDKGRFDDTNKMFVNPDKYDLKVNTKNAEKWSKVAHNMLMNIKE